MSMIPNRHLGCVYTSNGFDTDGTEWFHCQTHGELAPSEHAPCEGYYPPHYVDPNWTAEQDREAALKRYHTEAEWMAEHGTTLEAYVERYGSASDPVHYGNGGEAIWAADMAALHKAEDAALDAIVAARRAD